MKAVAVQKYNQPYNAVTLGPAITRPCLSCDPDHGPNGEFEEKGTAFAFKLIRIHGRFHSSNKTRLKLLTYTSGQLTCGLPMLRLFNNFLSFSHKIHDLSLDLWRTDCLSCIYELNRVQVVGQ